jgi:hypothetical protein
MELASRLWRTLFKLPPRPTKTKISSMQTSSKPRMQWLRWCRFYYVDERKDSGAPAYADISGEGHGDYYAELAEHKTQGPWLQTFVTGKGYRDFSGSK